MKYYTITVNGNTYEVSVEESNGLTRTVAPAPVSAPVAPAAPKAAAPAPAPAAPSNPAPAPAASSSVGAIKVNAPMPGKIIALKASVGQAVKRGEVILILEAMKMENEIVATEDGIISSINVTAGQTVEAGDLLASLN